MRQPRTSPDWAVHASRFLQAQYRPDACGYPSVPGGAVTLYGTAYALLTRHYLGEQVVLSAEVREFLADCQDPDTGYFIGPELRNWSPAPSAKHDREHLLLHLACAALPAILEFGMRPRYPLHFAHRFCDSAYLADWLERRDMRDAWLEGNNLLFVGQLLGHLREIEAHPGADQALEQWFRWLDDSVDPETGLWGTQKSASSPLVAMCGAYHQLLVYYREGRSIRSPQRLMDTVLRLQHPDGGFSPAGGGGACEDVDAVDILVNCYKRFEYRRPYIRAALRRATDAILSAQNEDGGFCYKRGLIQDHMGIPDTRAAANVSTTFATWFRVHALALIAEIITDDARLDFSFRFNRFLSMGWHEPWHRARHQIAVPARLREIGPALLLQARQLKHQLRNQLR